LSAEEEERNPRKRRFFVTPQGKRGEGKNRGNHPFLGHVEEEGGHDGEKKGEETVERRH